jgi:hypothetical protein
MSVNLNDLQLVEQIIRVCQARGAFQVEEMQHISELYRKVVQILRQNQPDISEEKKTQSPSRPAMANVPSTLTSGSPFTSYGNPLGTNVMPL